MPSNEETKPFYLESKTIFFIELPKSSVKLNQEKLTPKIVPKEGKKKEDFSQ